MMIPLDRKSGIPLFSQVYQSVRDMILAGILKEGESLPPSRKLADDLRVSRNVILNAYDQLFSEGFLESRAGSGTFVAKGAVFQIPGIRQSVLSAPVGFKDIRFDIIDFRSGLPDLFHFPLNIWNRISREVQRDLTPRVLGYQHPEGMNELRTAVAEYVSVRRGAVCHKEQVVITAGTTQAIGIIGRLLLSSGGIAVIEEPLTSDIREILKNIGGGEIFPAVISGGSINTKDLPEDKDIKLIYVTPSHHFPLGTAMSIQDRISLVKWAMGKNLYIVEDDYDSEFRYDGPPVSSIQGLAPDHVVYIGTFSKTLFPSLRIGYLILPEKLVGQGRQVKWFTDLHNPAVDQLILARFIAEGYYSRHISRMKKIYSQKRSFLETLLRNTFRDKVEILGVPCGIHLSVRFPGFHFTGEKLRQLEEEGVCCYSVSGHSMYPEKWIDILIFGYGMLEEERMEEGIGILHRFLCRSMKNGLMP